MRASRQPIVFVDIEIADGVEVVLIIGNSGDAPARHVHFDVEDGIPWEGNPRYALSELPAIKQGLPYLAPGRLLRFRLGFLDWVQATTNSGWMNVRIAFDGEEGRKFDHEACIDLRRYEGLSLDTFARYEEHAVEALQGILRLGTEVADRGRPNSTTRWCPACSKPMSHSAKKCAECGEWLPGANKEPDAASSPPAS